MTPRLWLNCPTGCFFGLSVGPGRSIKAIMFPKLPLAVARGS